MLDPNKSVLIVMDPQKGFTNAEGTIAKAFGFEELKEVQQTLAKLNVFLKGLDKNQQVLFIRSEYKQGQFTNNDTKSPLNNLCVKDSLDCDWAEGLHIPEQTHFLTKHHTDATYEHDYLNYLEYKLGEQYTDLYFAGFMTSTCIKKTLLSTENFFHTKFNYNLLTDFSAARTSYYKERLTSIYKELEAVGCEIL